MAHNKTTTQMLDEGRQEHHVRSWIVGRKTLFQQIRQVCQGIELTSRTKCSGNHIKIRVQIIQGTECERWHRARSQRTGEECGEALKTLKQEYMTGLVERSRRCQCRAGAALHQAITAQGSVSDSLQVLGSKSPVKIK